MASLDQFITQWKHNRSFAKTIPSRYRDWQVNAVFYIAIHVVNAALAKLGVRVTSHTDRNSVVENNAAISSIKYQYMDLYRISVVTRYDADPDGWIPRKYTTVNDLADDLLKPIENHMFSIMEKKSMKYEPLGLQT